VCHVGKIGILWVRFILLTPPVSYVQQPKCTANLHWIAVVIIEIGFNLPPVHGCFRRRIWKEPGGGQLACCAIALSRCRLSPIFRRWVLFIIAGRILWIKRWLTGSWSCCRVDEIAAREAFLHIDWHTSMFGTEFILHIPHKWFLVLGSIWCLVLRFKMHSVVRHSKRSQLPKRMEHMCSNKKHARHGSYSSVVFGQLLSS